MTDLFFVAYVAMPLTVIAMGIGAVYAHKIYMDRLDAKELAEAESKKT